MCIVLCFILFLHTKTHKKYKTLPCIYPHKNFLALKLVDLIKTIFYAGVYCLS